MKQRIIGVVETFNENSEYNLDAAFYTHDDELLVRLFTRFGSGGDIATDKFMRELDMSRVDDVDNAVEEALERIIEHAEESGFTAEDEYETDGELN